MAEQNHAVGVSAAGTLAANAKVRSGERYQSSNVKRGAKCQIVVKSHVSGALLILYVDR